MSAPEHLPYVRLHFELQVAADRHPELYGRFLDELVASWVDLIGGRLEDLGLGRSRARSVATFIYATVRGLQLDLLATGDRKRVDGGYRELKRSAQSLLAARD